MGLSEVTENNVFCGLFPGISVRHATFAYPGSSCGSICLLGNPADIFPSSYFSLFTVYFLKEYMGEVMPNYCTFKQSSIQRHVENASRIFSLGSRVASGFMHLERQSQG